MLISADSKAVYVQFQQPFRVLSERKEVDILRWLCAVEVRRRMQCLQSADFAIVGGANLERLGESAKISFSITKLSPAFAITWAWTNPMLPSTRAVVEAQSPTESNTCLLHRRYIEAY